MKTINAKNFFIVTTILACSIFASYQLSAVNCSITCDVCDGHNINHFHSGLTVYCFCRDCAYEWEF